MAARLRTAVRLVHDVGAVIIMVVGVRVFLLRNSHRHQLYVREHFLQRQLGALYIQLRPAYRQARSDQPKSTDVVMRLVIDRNSGLLV